MERSQVSDMLGKNILVTTDQWFFAPDGSQYRAAYGKLLEVVDSKDALGIRTNSKSSNWYVQVGRVLIAGCQVHYAVNCEGAEMNFGDVESELTHEGKLTHQKTPTRIYNANFPEDNS